MPDSVDSGVSESDVLSMFDKDGDLREEPQAAEEDSSEEAEAPEEAEEEETEAEEEPEEEAEETEDEESEEDEEKAPELDWSKVDPAHRSAFEASQKEVSKLRKDYGKLHSKYAEISQSRRETDQNMQTLQAQAEQASEWNAILEQHPELVDQFVDLVKKARNPDQELPEHLKDDPAIQFMMKRNQQLESQLKQLSEQTKPLGDWKAQQAEAANRQKLDNLLGEAATEYKSMFGKDMGEAEKTAVLKYMVEKKYYESGSNAALSVFGPEYKKALSQKQVSDLKAKAQKFGAKTKSVNSRQATSAPKINSQTDAITQALRDQGMDI